MASQSRWFPKPDWALAVVLAALVLPAALQDTASGPVGSLDDQTFQYRPGLLVLLYIVFECARTRRPGTGAVVGAFALTLLTLVLGVENAVKHGTMSYLNPGTLLAAVATGAVLGAVIGSIGWLVEWLVRRPAVRAPVQRPEPVSVRPSRVVTAMAAALVLCLLAESAGWAVQAGVGFHEWLSYYIIDGMGWPAWEATWKVVEPLVQLDRLVVVALASLSTYATLRRWRAARGLIVAWGLTALALAVVRVLFFQRLGLPDVLGELTSTSEYTYVNLYTPRPALPAPVLFDVMRLEVPIRAALCVVGLPYVLLSKRLKEYLGAPRFGSVAATPNIPARS